MDLINILKELDKELDSKGPFFKLIICGGASVVLFEGSDRATKDVDLVVEPPHYALECARAIAGRLSLNDNWLNPFASVFNDNIPDGWEDRLRYLDVKFKNFAVLSMSRQDLISAKVKSHIDRGFDLEDLKIMNVSISEFNKAKEFVLSKNNDEITKLDLDQLMGDLF